jgi:hypothetical protein
MDEPGTQDPSVNIAAGLQAKYLERCQSKNIPCKGVKKFIGALSFLLRASRISENLSCQKNRAPFSYILAKVAQTLFSC